MNLLDRYVFKSVLFTCAAAVALFALIVIIPNIARDLLPHILAGHLPALTSGKLLLLLVPFAITYALPMGMLTGVLLTLGRLSADSEVTAMRAAGISVVRLTRPVIILAVLGVGLGLYFNFDSMPRARVEYHRAFARALETNPLSIITPKTFIRNFSGHVVYVGDKQGSIMRDIWVWELDSEGRVERLVRAESGRFEYNEDRNSLMLTLTQAKVESRPSENPERFEQPQLVASLGQWGPIQLSLDRFFGRTNVRMKQEWLTLDQLQEARTRLAIEPTPADPEAARTAERARMKLDMIFHDKINTSLAVLSLALIGVPLGIKVSRRETSANFAVAVGVTLAYYLMTVVIKVLDRHPEYRPDLLLWIPNLLLIGVGAWLMSRIERR